MIASAPLSGFPRPSVHRALALAVTAAVCLLVLPVMAARADTPSTLTVVGTSDVQDSGLIPKLITPMFQKAFPQYTLKYVSVGTGVAINDAESGVASALLVHAASLENQFVAQGYSAERYGRAIFYGDYVLLGPASDPAGVLTNAPHDIASAFARVAATGAAGKADFVSRGGTPGTTVQEHAIWALDAGSPGLTLCDVTATNGGGKAPSMASGPCPSTSSNPPWYHTTGLTQGPNIEAGNTCNFANASASGSNDCYVFTDRGTFDCLTSAQCSGGSAAPSNLKIMARNNSATAQGGNTLLINSFHAYAINPAKFAGNPNVQINATAAKDFLDLITSPNFQSRLKTYLAGTDNAPFTADAAASITATKLPGRVTGGRTVTVTGTIANLVPGTPPLAGQTVNVSEVVSGVAAAIPIASTKTNSAGGYTLTFSPPNTGSYQVTTGLITQIENSTLNPTFGDLLQPGAAAPANIAVKASLGGLSVTPESGRVLVAGSVQPASHVKASAVLLARKGRRGTFRKVASSSLGNLDHGFALSATSKPGTWYLEVRFQDPGQVVATTTKPDRISIPPPGAASITASAIRISRGRFTINGRLGPHPTRSGAVVRVFALDAGALRSGRRSAAAASSSARFRTIAAVRVGAGATKFTVHGRLKRGQHWLLQLQYAAGGVAGAGYSGLRSLRIT